MERNDTNIHRMELLITIDYLLKFTNEKHPATFTAIVEYALNKYDFKTKRDRIASALCLLKEYSDEFDFPYVIEQTHGGKYYVDIKYNMTEDKLIDLLFALKNDKYFKEEDKEYFENILLEAFSNTCDYDAIKEKLKTTRIKRQMLKNNRKLEIVKKALESGKTLLTYSDVYDADRKIYVRFKNYYKVFKIIEYNNRPYALLVPFYGPELLFVKWSINSILTPIDELNIPDLPTRDILTDYGDKADMNELFKKDYPKEYAEYGSLDNYLEKYVMPSSGVIVDIAFCFPVVLLDTLKNSYQRFFNDEFTWSVLDTKNIKEKYNYDIKNPNLKYILVEKQIDINAFMSWGFSDPYNRGQVNVFDCIDIIKPLDINNRIKTYYERHLNNYKK